MLTVRSSRPGGEHFRLFHTFPPGRLLGAGLLAVLAGCGGSPAEAPRESVAGGALFVDIATSAGLDFRHFNGMSGEYYMAEVIGPGAALFDYDNDGDLDVYLVQGRMLGTDKTLADASFPPESPADLTDRLFRNDLLSAGGESGPLRFTDVTAAAGLSKMTGYGVGVAAGDYDNDGWIDLYVTNFGANRLLRNVGDGTFADVTEEAGVGGAGHSVPAAFLDFDSDGWLDLFVVNYVDFRFADPVICRDMTGARDYCGPASYEPQQDRLYRNGGDGTFTEVTQQAGIDGSASPGLGLVVADLNGDLLTDVYVTNDGTPNHFWVNQGNGTFADEALLAGCAVNASGKAEASMGVDAADHDRDGDLDLFMTHLVAETNTIFVNNGAGLFTDRTAGTELSASSRIHTAFGTGWLDYDNDGWLDLVVVNGAVKKIEALARLDDPFPLHEPNQLYRNLGATRVGHFQEVTQQAGDALNLSEVSRGAAIGDIDNDGDADVLVANNNAPVRLLLNQVGQANHWLGLELRSKTGQLLPDTRAALLQDGAPWIWGRVRIEGSYASANDPRVLFGLGSKASFDGVRVVWPGGTMEEWPPPPIDAYTTLEQGTGAPVTPVP